MTTNISALSTGCIILTLLICTIPAQAFTADSLSIDVQNNGDATIDFEYTLSIPEKIAVFLKIADPNEELKKALESNFHLPVAVESVSDSSAQFSVSRFASRSEKNGSNLLQTPAISFTMAEKVLKNYWFAPLVKPDFSPGITTITYPDGYTEQFEEQISIPKTSHILKT